MLPLLVHAQDKYPNLLLKFNITGLTDVFTIPMLELHAEKRISPRFAIAVEAGDQVPIQFHGDAAYKLALEGRCYTKPDGLRAKHRHYIALNPFYRYRYSRCFVEYTDPYPQSHKADDQFTVTRNFYGINAVLGDQLLYKHFTMDYSFGLGAVYKYIQNGPRTYDPQTYQLDKFSQSVIDRLSIYNSLSENSGWKLNVSLTVRIGYICCNKIKKNNRYKEMFARPK